MSWPRDPRPWAEAPHPGAYLLALYSPDVPNREHAHEDFRTVDDPTRLHRAGVRWTDPVQLAGVRLRWRSGYRPGPISVVVETPEGPRPHPVCPETDTVTVPVSALATGVLIEQPPGAGGPAAPGVMRISALSIQVAAAAAPAVTLFRDGVEHTPTMPLATDGSEHTFLDVSDALSLQVAGPWQRFEGVCLTLRRVGAAGSPASLRRWLARPGPVLWVDERVVPATRWLDTEKSGVVSGTCVVAFVPDRPTFGRRVRIALPDPPHAMALEALTWGPPTRGERIEPDLALDPPRPARPPTPTTLAAAAELTHPLRHALSLGTPGCDARVGVLPDGGLVIPRDTHARCVHLALTLDGVRLPPPSRRWLPDEPILECFSMVESAEVCWSARVEAGTLWLDASTTAGRLGWAVAEREGFARHALDPALARILGLAAAVEEQHTTAGSHLSLRIPLGDAPATPLSAATAEVLRGRLTPTGGFRSLLDDLLRQAALFIQAGPRVAYGLFPSVYAGDVFGLEEDYLFRGLAYWGAGATALAAFRNTYLTPGHLDPRHYLNDLRMGLTPWQLDHLLRLTGHTFHDLTPAERGLVEHLGHRILDGRRHTAHETGAARPGGGRVFPGLLPPFRFGGDLDFPTQSLYVNAVAWCGLRSVARLAGWPIADTLAEYKAAILRAFDVMATVAGADRQPLHSGGDDPADYYQLMACGILDPMDFFAPGDARAARIDAQVERDERLWCHLPRFDGWGGGQSIDAVYGHGYLLNALRGGRPDVFRAGLLTLLTAAMDRDVHTFREVGPIQLTAEDPGHWLPGRRLGRSEPCVGSLGVALQLLRHAFVTELPDADGALGRRLLVGAGVLPEWWQEPFEINGLPTLAGPVDLAWHPTSGPRVQAPGAASVTWVDARGALREVAPCT